MNTKQLLILALSCTLAIQVVAMDDHDYVSEHNRAVAEALADLDAKAAEANRTRTEFAIAHVLDQYEAEARRLQEEDDSTEARRLQEEYKLDLAYAEQPITNTDEDELFARQIAEQLRQEEREEQERAGLETAQRLEAEWNSNK